MEENKISIGKEPFGVMVKPVGSLCNMRCSYCYYLDTDRGSDSKVMSFDLLEKYIREYIVASSGPLLQFFWHGGEPTLAGIDFYQRAIELQKKHLPSGYSVINNIQTNGLLLDDEWCAFLVKEQFLVGLSIDGTEVLHDKYRRDVSGKNSYKRIRDNIKRLQKHGIQPDLLCTLTSEAAQTPLEVYRTLRDLATGWLQFIPIIIYDNDGSVTPESLTAKAYGEFLCQVFDEWSQNDIGKTDVQLFAELGISMVGGTASVCWLQKNCGRVVVLEKDGNVYSCDHFVDQDHLLGNLYDTGLEELVNQNFQQQFGLRKETELPARCLKCQWLNLCNGGCPKDAKQGINILCEGYERFFSENAVKLEWIMKQRLAKLNPKIIMAELERKEF